MPDKTQQIRLLDVFLIGPTMIALSVTATKAPPWLTTIVGISGLFTILYNGANFLRITQQQPSI